MALALEAAAEASGHGDVPVVVFSAGTSSQINGIPASGILRKPFDVDDLLATVAQHAQPVH